MAKRTRHQEHTKRVIAQRYRDGDDPEQLASEYNIAVSTVKEYNKLFPAPRKVKRRVMMKSPKENTRVSELEKENQKLRGLVEFWHEAYNAVITNNK